MLGRRAYCVSRLASIPQHSSCPSHRVARTALSSLSPHLKSDIWYKVPVAVVVPASLLSTRSPSLTHVSRSISLNMSTRRSKSTKSTNGESNGHAPLANGSVSHPEEHKHEHDEHDHSHSHSIFHSHSHGEEGHNHGHEKIMEALQGGGEYSIRRRLQN